MGIIETHQTVAAFWYRRVNEIALFTSLIIIMLWVLPFIGLDPSELQPLIVTVPTLAIASAALVVSLISMLMQRNKTNKTMTVVTMLSLAVTIFFALHDTGNLSSPLLVFWVILALFAASAGGMSFIPISIGALLYGVYLFISEPTTIAQWIIFGLAIIVPLLKGLFIWLRRYNLQAQSSQTVTELASELDQEANKSSIIINSIADGVVLINPQGLIDLINPAAEKIVGWASHDAAKLDYRSVLKIVNSKDEILDDTTDPIQECFRNGQSVITERFSLRTVSGKQVPASIMVSPLSGDAGVVVVFRDITVQRAEERDQAEFVSTASHEMRTPVAAIEGYLGLALNPQTATIDEKARTYLVKAQESAKHLGGLFQDLLDISKVEDGRLDTKLTIINIPAFVKDLLGDFSGQVAEKSLTLIYAPDTSSTGGTAVEPLYYASVDQSHLKEVLANLVGNAIKYTKEGSVTVDVTADNDHVFISVKDTGIGIPAEDIPHLFQKFYRVDNSDTREIGGTGLGLYLARRLTESMRGRLTLESNYGSGSTFTVELPRVSREQAERPNLSAPQSPPETVTPPTPAPASVPTAAAPPTPVQAPTTTQPLPQALQTPQTPLQPAAPTSPPQQTPPSQPPQATP